ncbi:two-component sensor histidine kinase [Rhodobacteraceae bacterium W635]|uniref:ATP-binding protein n=1 Tax=Nioella halotolerans TaxID=2303578 RepID=UPI000E3CCA2E|nr:two-component sensor histidine kinase [Rhodobacteraceae bacterium W635]
MPRSTLIDTLCAVPDPMLRIAPGGQIDEANTAAEAMLGEWIRQRSFVTVLRQPVLISQIEAAFRDAKPGTTRFTKTDQAGETVYRVQVTPLSAGEDGVLLHFADVSHFQEAEEMRRDFVANVSHELRSPLTALMGFIETLRGPARDDAEARDRFLSIMEDQALRMNRLVGDLLSLSRVEAEERIRPSQDVDLRDLLDGVIAALDQTAREQDSPVNIEAAPGDYRLRGDTDQLTQVFMNLTENALKYGGAGRPVTLRLSDGEGKGALRGPVVQVEVIDRGDGIDPLHLPRLTERFYRVDSHRSREMGGTGLGLAIVKHIVNRHRGRLRISSELGKGSTFAVILPRG